MVVELALDQGDGLGEGTAIAAEQLFEVEGCGHRNMLLEVVAFGSANALRCDLFPKREIPDRRPRGDDGTEKVRPVPGLRGPDRRLRGDDLSWRS